MSGPPPSRYRIEERGRRLVVIDTRADEAKGPPHSTFRADPPPSAKSGEPSSGSDRVIVTRRWFDHKAPRTIVLTEDRVQRLYLLAGVLFAIIGVLFFVFPGAPLLLLVVAFIGGRKGLTAIATPWLDLAEEDGRR